MGIKIDIVSGFLGSGKTTFIKKIIDDAFKREKVAIIENEFGEVSIDGEILKDRNIDKYYRTVVSGVINDAKYIEGYLTKNESTNVVTISDSPIDSSSSIIKTEYRPIKISNNITLLEVHLITGKSHQIRAHLASIGHPIIGDPKYGNHKINEFYYKNYKIKNQLLHAYMISFPDETSYIAPMPDIYSKIVK